jgi:hypothetical protein
MRQVFFPVLLVAAITCTVLPNVNSSLAAPADDALKEQLLGAWSLRDQTDCRAGRTIFAADDFLMSIDRRPEPAAKFPWFIPYHLRDGVVEFPNKQQNLRSLRVDGKKLTYENESGSHAIVRCLTQGLEPDDLALANQLLGAWTRSEKPDCKQEQFRFASDGQFQQTEGKNIARGVYWIDSGALYLVKNYLVAETLRGDKPPPRITVRFEGGHLVMDVAKEGPAVSMDRCPS